MNFFYEILPVLLFFITFKMYGIYMATVVGIAATAVQVICTYLIYKKWDKKQIITFVVFLVFGGMTLYFHNPIFVKWKPTIVFWVFGVIILISHFFLKQPLIKHMMENVLRDKGMIPDAIWRRINWFWALFFILLGSINLYVAYKFDNETWVNFKVFGVTGALLIFSILQALYLLKHLIEIKHDKPK